MRYNKYTDKEIKDLLDSMVVLIDSREQKTDHIIDYFKSKKISYITTKLDHVDYSCMIPKNEELGIIRDMYFTDIVSIERKASLTEVAGNFTKGRTQIENEFIRGTSRGAKMYLVIEEGTYDDLIHGRYRSEYNPKSFMATLKSFQIRYNLNIEFIDKKCSPNSIYYSLYYYTREVLKYGKVQAV